MPPSGEGRQDWLGTAGPDSLKQPPHRMPQLTTSELRTYRRELEHAIKGISAAAPVQADLRRTLDEVMAELEDRARLAAGTREHDVTGLTSRELERAKRELQANLALARPDSPVRGPILAHMNAIDAELADRSTGEAKELSRLPGCLSPHRNRTQHPPGHHHPRQRHHPARRTALRRRPPSPQPSAGPPRSRIAALRNSSAQLRRGCPSGTLGC